MVANPIRIGRLRHYRCDSRDRKLHSVSPMLAFGECGYGHMIMRSTVESMVPAGSRVSAPVCWSGSIPDDSVDDNVGISDDLPPCSDRVVLCSIKRRNADDVRMDCE